MCSDKHFIKLGMTTLPNPILFADVNECEDSDCQQACINYPGGYNCSCYNGYRTNATDYKHCDGKRTNLYILVKT